jgi:cell division septum initiation protein DivIVA
MGENISIPASYDELQREVMDLRKRIDRLEREAEAKARTAHYPPVRPLREPNYRTLGNRLEQDDDGA